MEKEDWSFWDRVCGEMQRIIDKLETELKVNRLFLGAAFEARGKFKKPKPQVNSSTAPELER